MAYYIWATLCVGIGGVFGRIYRHMGHVQGFILFNLVMLTSILYQISGRASYWYTPVLLFLCIIHARLPVFFFRTTFINY